MSPSTRLLATGAATATSVALALAGIASAAVDEPAIDWQTEHVEMRADALRLRLDETTLTTAGSDVRVHEWLRGGDRIELRVRWSEAEASHDLYFGFSPSDGRWAITDIRYLQGAPGVREVGAPSSPFHFAVTDAAIAPTANVPGDGALRVDASVPVYACEGTDGPSIIGVDLELDGLRLDVTPPEWTFVDDLRQLVGRGPQPRGDWLGHAGYDGPPVAVACTPPVAATLEDESIAQTRPAEPGIVADLLTEEVEPGVLRVSGDGIRELRSESLVACWSLAHQKEMGARDGLAARRGYDGISRGKVVAGLDGGIWLFWHDRFVRLGDEATHPWVEGQSLRLEDDIEVAPDGTIWHAPSSGSGRAEFDRDLAWATEYLDTLRSDPEAFVDRPECLADARWIIEGDGALRAYRDGAWDVALRVPTQAVRHVEIGPDDSIWVAWHEATPAQRIGPLAARLGADGWSIFGSDSARTGAPRSLVLGQDGTVFVQTSRGKPSSLWRLAAAAGQSPGDWLPIYGGTTLDDVVMSPDGVLWGRGRESTIVRFDGEDWRVWDLAHNTDPSAPNFLGGGGPLAAGQEGSVWLKARPTKAARGCHGIYNFDGADWTQFLDGHCVYSIDVAPDGWLWLRAGPDPDGQHAGTVDLYAISPDAPESQQAEPPTGERAPPSTADPTSHRVRHPRSRLEPAATTW